MKKTLLLVSALTLASTAAADQVGVFIAGAQYQQDNGLRYGLGLPAAGFFNGGGALSLNGDVSYLIPLASNAGDAFAPYYGFGLGLGFAIGGGNGVSAGGVSVYPNVLAGVDFRTGTPFTPFAEASVGPTLSFAAASGGGSTSAGLGFGFGFGLRLGVNYRLQ